MYTVTRNKPDGSFATHEARTINEAGRIVFYSAHDNSRADRETATRVAMECERTGTAHYGGYTYTISKEPQNATL